ncbi:MAG: hypothetical protein ACPL68_02180, partial [Candidatus Hydrothermia bacterium]
MNRKKDLYEGINMTTRWLVSFTLLSGVIFANVHVVADFDDGNLGYPLVWSWLITGGTGNILAEPGGMGTYSLHATYTLSTKPSFNPLLMGRIQSGVHFGGSGLFFYARGRGIWDIGVAVSGCSTSAHYRLMLTDDWRDYYIPLNELFYAYNETIRPPLDTNLFARIDFRLQELQPGASGELWLDSLGYYYSEGPQSWDYDGDGIPDSRDPDADSDRWPDTLEIIAGTNPLDSLDHPTGDLGVPAGCYFGLFPVLGLTDEWLVFSDITGLKPALVTIFVDQWGNSTRFYHFDRTACDFVARQGGIPVYQWPMMRRGTVPPEWEWLGSYPIEGRFSPESVAAGVYDADIAAFAREVADWGLPMFINPLVEYNTGLVQYSGLTNFGPDAQHVPPKDSMGVFGRWFGDTLIHLCGAVPGDSMCNYYGDPSLPDGPERV